MKIRKLHIQNYKAIKNVVLDDIKDVVVIAGPNGCGKTAIFDAIRLLKSAYGSYVLNEFDLLCNEFLIKRVGNAFDYSSLFQDKAKSVTIHIDFEFSETERTYLAQNIDTFAKQLAITNFANNHNIPLGNIISSEIEKSLEHEINTIRTSINKCLSKEVQRTGIEIKKDSILRYENHLITLYFSLYQPESLGIMDFISADRIYNKQSVGGININNIQTKENLKNHALYNVQNKYNQMKMDMASSYFDYLLKKEQGIQNNSEFLWNSISELFSNFFSNKEFIKTPAYDRNGNISFNVIVDKEFEHDIDDLSSGEKEILMGYLRLINLKPRNSIILFDEPELHLNPKLVKGLPRFYEKNIGKSFNNQIWLISHSDALLKETVTIPDYSVYQMFPAKDVSTNESQTTNITGKTDIENIIISLVGNITSIYRNSKIVFVEGENSEFDRNLIEDLFPETENKLIFVSAKNKNNVIQSQKIFEAALKEAGYNTKCYSIFDKDIIDVKESKNSQYSLDVYHLENYLLSSDSIYKVVLSLQRKKSPFNSAIELEKELKNIAISQKEQYVILRIQQVIGKEIKEALSLDINKKSQRISKDLSEKINKNKKTYEDISKRFTVDVLNEMEDSFSKEYSTFMDSVEWYKHCIGREVLRDFSKKHIQGTSYTTFVNLIISVMKEDHYKPAGLKSIIDKIIAD